MRELQEIERIERLTSLDLAAGGDRLALHLGLRMWRLWLADQV